MEGHGIGGLGIDALDDVDLARVGPVGAKRPEGRPLTAGAAGHMSEVENDEACIVRLFGGDADRVAATAGGNVLTVHAHVDGIVLGADQAGRLSGGLVDVVHIAMSGVIGLEIVVSRHVDNGLTERLAVKKSNMEKKLLVL